MKTAVNHCHSCSWRACNGFKKKMAILTDKQPFSWVIKENISFHRFIRCQSIAYFCSITNMHDLEYAYVKKRRVSFKLVHLQSPMLRSDGHFRLWILKSFVGKCLLKTQMYHSMLTFFSSAITIDIQRSTWFKSIHSFWINCSNISSHLPDYFSVIVAN